MSLTVGGGQRSVKKVSLFIWMAPFRTYDFFHKKMQDVNNISLKVILAQNHNFQHSWRSLGKKFNFISIYFPVEKKFKFPYFCV